MAITPKDSMKMFLSPNCIGVVCAAVFLLPVFTAGAGPESHLTPIRPTLIKSPNDGPAFKPLLPFKAAGNGSAASPFVFKSGVPATFEVGENQSPDGGDENKTFRPGRPTYGNGIISSYSTSGDEESKTKGHPIVTGGVAIDASDADGDGNPVAVPSTSGNGNTKPGATAQSGGQAGTKINVVTSAVPFSTVTPPKGADGKRDSSKGGDHGHSGDHSDIDIAASPNGGDGKPGTILTGATIETPDQRAATTPNGGDDGLPSASISTSRSNLKHTSMAEKRPVGGGDEKTQELPIGGHPPPKDGVAVADLTEADLDLKSSSKNGANGKLKATGDVDEPTIAAPKNGGNGNTKPGATAQSGGQAGIAVNTGEPVVPSIDVANTAMQGVSTTRGLVILGTGGTVGRRIGDTPNTTMDAESTTRALIIPATDGGANLLFLIFPGHDGTAVNVRPSSPGGDGNLPGKVGEPIQGIPVGLDHDPGGSIVMANLPKEGSKVRYNGHEGTVAFDNGVCSINWGDGFVTEITAAPENGGDGGSLPSKKHGKEHPHDEDGRAVRDSGTVDYPAINMVAHGTDGQGLPNAEVQIQDEVGQRVATLKTDDKGCVAWTPPTGAGKHKYIGSVTLVR